MSEYFIGTYNDDDFYEDDCGTYAIASNVYDLLSDIPATKEDWFWPF